MSTLLEQVIEAVQTLPEMQLKEVLDFVGYLKSKKSKKSKVSQTTHLQPISEEKLLKVLQKEGLIDKLPDFSEEDEPELEPIPYTGKSLSEIIIEDRDPK